MEKSLPVDWQCLLTNDSDSDNIRLHELEQGHQLTDLLNGFKNAKAAVLINTTDSYELPQDLMCEKKLTFPVVIVKKTDGASIIKHMKSVEACIEAENSVDRPLLNTEQGWSSKCYAYMHTHYCGFNFQPIT